MHRPHPAQSPVSPPHRFRPGEIADNLRHDLGYHVGGGPAGPLDERHIEVALLVGSRFGPIEGLQAGGFEKSLDRGVRRADAWTFALLAHIRRAGWQAINHHGQAAWRGEAPSCVEAKPSLLQRIAEEAREIVGSARLHARRDLFAKQLEQKLSHGRPGAYQAWAPPASVFSHAAQHARASPRTRKTKPCRSARQLHPRAS